LSPDGRSWDDDALDQNLVPLDAAVVRWISLGRPSIDTWAWSGEHHGIIQSSLGSACLRRLQLNKELFWRKRQHTRPV
jgi:hypothetical protein